ncbi:hypothetical protein VKT23_009191 [Stygiomarasmius scandens]|uniref:Uncharacterized protein n=1 Tax=Marasmiellus scandens TaxID=2682957 RepID=A0ABR1JJC9_9AGAR
MKPPLSTRKIKNDNSKTNSQCKDASVLQVDEVAQSNPPQGCSRLLPTLVQYQNIEADYLQTKTDANIKYNKSVHLDTGSGFLDTDVYRLLTSGNAGHNGKLAAEILISSGSFERIWEYLETPVGSSCRSRFVDQQCAGAQQGFSHSSVPAHLRSSDTQNEDDELI